MARHNRRSVAAFLSGPGSTAVQPLLLERTMQERSPTLVRLRHVVEDLLGARLREMGSKQGGYSYDPCSLFLVLLFGYMQGVRSSRRLEEACRFDRRYEYLSDGLEPDHATLARFRRKTQGELEDLFLLVCEEAKRRGILEHKTMVVDGTKVAAVRSQWQRALREAEEIDLWEEEAKTMLTGNRWVIGYNLQVAADMKSGMIVGYVATNSENDMNQMPDVLAAVERQSGQLPEQAVADRGYDTPRNTQAVYESGVKPFIPRSDRKRPPFRLNGNGQVVCPAGHVATKMSKPDSRRSPAQLFRVKKCAKCAMKTACGIKGKSRDFLVPFGVSLESRFAGNENCETEEGRRLVRLRGPTIERIFGQLKGNQGFRRFVLRGMSGAAIELGIIALGYNLNALI